MATLALAVAGAAAGSALLPAGITVLGATLSGAALGAQIGAFAGSYVDQALFAPSAQTRTVTGPRLTDVHVTSSSEGAPIPRLYGRARLGGQIIWADDIEERVSRKVTGESTGKGLGGAATPSGATETIEYRYYASFAVALCEGEVSALGRVWADGEPINLSRYVHRLHKGSNDQAPDSLISTRLGAASAPAFRGTAYVVFQAMPLARFGNRIPQLSFEVYRAVEPFGEEIRGVVMIPGSGEFVYATEPVARIESGGRRSAENVHTRVAATDWAASLDQLSDALPNVASVSLVVSWFGSDLRAASCRLRPGVESATKETQPETWRVAGLERDAAHLVSTREGRPAYGGTPSDKSVTDAIRDLGRRGYAVTLTPFVLMDVPEGNALPSPYGGTGQPAYPWRGRITVSPAPGEPGSPDKTAAAAAEIEAFVGTAGPSDFSIVDGEVVYAGPVEWSYRRMVLHHAYLAKAAGGVSAFVIGSELRGLSFVRDGAASYPFVAALVDLAADVRAVLGPDAKITYAADWSEYFGHQPVDGSGDVFFHLDPLWAAPEIDAVGIDLYWPLSDWRDGAEHTDLVAGARSIHDLDYLSSNVAGGEGFDWYYASSSDRDQQIRTPITDGAVGKPWVFRFKDIRSWWLNEHYDRPGGIEAAMPTGWVPQSKPIWIMEVGCPAVDKGANQPNVFVDPKSSETSLPYYSRGSRDDLMQRRYLQALIRAFDPASPGYVEGSNPSSVLNGAPMVDLEHIHVYAWDARPFPAFPYNTESWGDGENWRLGHWLTGRFAAAPLAEAVAALLKDYGFASHDASTLNGTFAGYVVDRVMSVRDALQPLELAFFFDSIESGGAMRFAHRGATAPVASLSLPALVETRADEPLLSITRAQETDLPASAKLTYISSAGDYRQAVADSRRLAGASGRVSQAELPIVLEPELASQIAESWLFEAWAARERVRFALPPSSLALEPGDIVEVAAQGSPQLVRITEIGEHGVREIEGRSIDPEVYAGVLAISRPGYADGPVHAGQPQFEFLDLPLLTGGELPQAGYVAALQEPWPGGVAVYSSPEDTGYVLRTVAGAPAVMGKLVDPLPAGPVGVVDKATRVRVAVGGGELSSVSRLQLLGGHNAAAVRNGVGVWEILQFESATLVGPGTYELANLLRGQAGTEHAMTLVPSGGAPFVLLTPEVAQIVLADGEVGLPLSWRVGPAALDISDPSFVTQSHAFSGAGLRPLAPVHVVGSRSGGDLAISWVRRTRIGGDAWEAPDVPLGEESERYEIEILDGVEVRRTLASSTPTAIYAAAQQIADFGSPPSTVVVRIYQMSAAIGRGYAAQAAI